MPDDQTPAAHPSDVSRSLISLDVELTPRQVEWLQTQAAEQGLSLDHVLRSVVTAQIARNSSRSPALGATNRSEAATRTRETNDSAPASDSRSLIESLRAAHRHLQDLTQENGVEASSFREARSQLQAQLNRTGPVPDGGSSRSSEDAHSPDTRHTSMFDLMEGQ